MKHLQWLTGIELVAKDYTGYNQRQGGLDRSMLMNRLIILTISIVLLKGCSTVPDTFSPDNPIPPETYSHRTLHQALTKHVKDGLVNYPALAHDTGFMQYLDLLKRIAPQRLPTPNHRLAFWINVYNALAIKGILDGYSPATLAGRYAFFIDREYVIGGASLNLYDLEQDLLIPDFQEPRIHFAIVCASQSCPKLQSYAYTFENLDQQLTFSARQFINDSTRNRFDRDRKIAYLSKIFDWFSEDFRNHSGSLLAYVAQFVSNEDLATELRQTPYTIRFLDYDWSLNGPSPSAKPDPSSSEREEAKSDALRTFRFLRSILHAGTSRRTCPSGPITSIYGPRGGTSP